MEPGEKQSLGTSGDQQRRYIYEVKSSSRKKTILDVYHVQSRKQVESFTDIGIETDAH